MLSKINQHYFDDFNPIKISITLFLDSGRSNEGIEFTMYVYFNCISTYM